jgi:uncharacterized protein
MQGRDIEDIQEINKGLKPQTRISLWQAVFTVFIFCAICAVEYIFAYQNVAYGIGMGLGLVILIYVALSLLRFAGGIIDCIESLALIPLYILFTSSLPWFFINQEFLLPAVYSCILALCFWHIYRNEINFKKLLNFKAKKLPEYLLITLAMGIATGTVEYLILRPAPAAPGFEIRYLLRDIVYMVFFVGLAEELLFRGLIQQSFTEVFGWKWAIFGASAMFAAMHMTWRSVPELGFVFAAGLIMGALYIRTKGLVAPILFHAANNVALVAVMPYLNIK